MRTALPLLMLSLIAGCKKEAVPAPPPAVKPDEPSLQVRIGGDKSAQLLLPFEIVKVYEAQKPSEQAPFHEAGGKWNYFDAKLADGTEFTVGLFDRLKLKSDPPMTLVDAVLIVPSAEAGQRLAVAYAKAFKATEPPVGKAAASQAVLKVSSVNLGENVKRSPGGGFGGSGGGWTASKWTIEREEHAAEVFFNFNLAEKKGEWSQKDSDYDADVAKDLMEVLHDGKN